MKLKNFLAIIAMSVILYSCQKEISVETKTPAVDVVFAQTPKEQATVAVLKEVGTILEEVYKNPKAYYEVCSAIYSEYYEDETVLLKDLLFPEFSPLYETQKFKASKSERGIFKKEFYLALEKAVYPSLKTAMGLNTNFAARNAAPSPNDTAKEIYSKSNGVAVYFPYSENFQLPLTTSYFDNINTDPWGNKATIVAADREADSGPGREPRRVKKNINNNVVFVIEYTNVTVNDTYAETVATHIVGVGAEPVKRPDTVPPTTTNINRVFHGWSKINANGSQLDKFISLSGNGGGSEMKIARISGYLQFANQQVTNFTGDVATAQYKRKEVRKKRWKRVYTVWDADWVAANLEQTYAVWEEDNQGTKTFTGSLGTTVTIRDTPRTTATGSIGYNIVVQTQDELITQRKLTRAAYFGAAKADQGWGFQMCDDKGCRYDDTFLPIGQYWPKYDDGAVWGYTWPYNKY